MTKLASQDFSAQHFRRMGVGGVVCCNLPLQRCIAPSKLIAFCSSMVLGGLAIVCRSSLRNKHAKLLPL